MGSTPQRASLLMLPLAALGCSPWSRSLSSPMCCGRAGRAPRSRPMRRHSRSPSPGSSSTCRRPPSASPVQRRPGAQERSISCSCGPRSSRPIQPRSRRRRRRALPAPAPTNRAHVHDHRGRRRHAAPAERVRTIYPRYAAAEAVAGPDGLACSPFRDGTPYQGEDLIYDPAGPAFWFAAPAMARAPRPAPASTSTDRGCRSRGALSARLAGRLAHGRRQHRAADREPAPARVRSRSLPRSTQHPLIGPGSSRSSARIGSSKKDERASFSSKNSTPIYSSPT